MYEKFFGFQRPPFELVPDPDFLFLGESHDAALANLVMGIESGKGFVAISGPVGTGKTTILRALLRRLGRGEKVCFLAQPELDTADLLRAILDGFEIRRESDEVPELRRALRAALRSSDTPGILIVDEAHLLSVDALEHIRLLSNLEEESRKLLQIILSGQPELKQILSSERLRPLAQRIEMFYEIEPLDCTDTHAYLDRRIRIAGNPDGLKVDARAADLIHECSGGVPRLINILADRTLITAYVAGTHHITERVVSDAYDDLGEITQLVMLGSPRTGRRGRPRRRVAAEPHSTPEPASPPEPAAALEPVAPAEPPPPFESPPTREPAFRTEPRSVQPPPPPATTLGPAPVEEPVLPMTLRRPVPPVVDEEIPPPASAATLDFPALEPRDPAPRVSPAVPESTPRAPSGADWELGRSGAPAPATAGPRVAARAPRRRLPAWRVGHERLWAGAGIAAIVVLAAVSLGNRQPQSQPRTEIAPRSNPARVVPDPVEVRGPAAPVLGGPSPGSGEPVEASGTPGTPERSGAGTAEGRGLPVTPEMSGTVVAPEVSGTPVTSEASLLAREETSGLPREPAAATASPVPAAAAPERASGVRWTIQAASFRTVARANTLAAQIRNDTGEPVRVAPATNESGLWYRVLVGEYTSRDDLAIRLNQLRDAYDLGFLRVVRLGGSDR